MVLRRSGWLIAKVLCFAVCLLAFVWALLRFTHHLPLPTARTVEFFGGRFALDLPKHWAIGYDSEPPHSLRLSHVRLPIAANLTLDDRLGVAQRDGAALLRSLGVEQPTDLGNGRASASVSRANGQPGVTHHVARVDASGRSLYMKLEVEMARGAEWLPSVAADLAFVHSSMRRAALNGDQDIARKEYDKWAPARAALQEIEADFQLSYDVLTWALLTFVVVWVGSHLLFETWLKLDKVRYTWVSQATTLTSLVGLLLAGAALVSNRMEHRAKLAESVILQVASAATFHMNEQASTCPKDWNVTIKVNPLIQDSKPVTIDCNQFRETMSKLARHLSHARTQIVKQGDFVDPGWVLGIPISMFIGQGYSIISSAALSDDQYEALSNRYVFFIEPLEQALRVVQKQSDFLASANAFKQLSNLWSVCLAGALALGMVKLSGDRRIEREKQRNDKAATTAPAPAPRLAPNDLDNTTAMPDDALTAVPIERPAGGVGPKEPEQVPTTPPQPQQ